MSISQASCSLFGPTLGLLVSIYAPLPHAFSNGRIFKLPSAIFLPERTHLHLISISLPGSGWIRAGIVYFTYLHDPLYFANLFFSLLYCVYLFKLIVVIKFSFCFYFFPSSPLFKFLLPSYLFFLCHGLPYSLLRLSSPLSSSLFPFLSPSVYLSLSLSLYPSLPPFLPQFTHPSYFLPLYPSLPSFHLRWSIPLIPALFESPLSVFPFSLSFERALLH